MGNDITEAMSELEAILAMAENGVIKVGDRVELLVNAGGDSGAVKGDCGVVCHVENSNGIPVSVKIKDGPPHWRLDKAREPGSVSMFVGQVRKLKPKCQHRFMAQTKDGPFSSCMKCGGGKVAPWKFAEALNAYKGSYPAYVDDVDEDLSVEASVPVGAGDQRWVPQCSHVFEPNGRGIVACKYCAIEWVNNAYPPVTLPTP